MEETASRFSQKGGYHRLRKRFLLKALEDQLGGYGDARYVESREERKQSDVMLISLCASLSCRGTSFRQARAIPRQAKAASQQGKGSVGLFDAAGPSPRSNPNLSS